MTTAHSYPPAPTASNAPTATGRGLAISTPNAPVRTPHAALASAAGRAVSPTAERPTSSPGAQLSPDQHRSALALLEAMLPGSANTPAADEHTLERVVEVFQHMSPHAVPILGAAVTALDRAALLFAGQRFSNLNPQSQGKLLERWRGHSLVRAPLQALAFAYKFVHFDRKQTYEALGGRLNVVAAPEEPRYRSQIVTAEEADETIECEVVVVGTGAGGAVVGKELAERGYAVAFLEEGGFFQRDSFTGSSIQAHFDFYRGSVTLGNAAMPVFAGRLVGGSTAINTGSCFRTPPWVLDRWCEDIDTDAFSPDRMRPYFDRVERILEVGEADLGAAGPIAQIMARGSDALGWKHAAMRRNAPGCRGEGFCDFGCRTDARKSTNLSYIPPALERGSLLVTRARAEHVLVERGRAVGIAAVAPSGRALRVRAKAVVLACGALPTPVLLQRQGICNRSGQLGRNLSVHPSGGISGLFDEAVRGHRHIPQGYYIEHFIREGILINAAQPDKNFVPIMFPQTGQPLMDLIDRSEHIAHFGVLISDASANGLVFPGPKGLPIIRYQLSRRDLDQLHRGLVLAGKMALAAGAKRLFPVCIPAPDLKSTRDFEHFQKRRLSGSDLMLTSYHPLGTCKLGKDPKTSVVDLDHQSHDVKGLFVVDGSTVPGPISVNPQITIMAMATRAAERIAEHLD